MLYVAPLTGFDSRLVRLKGERVLPSAFEKDSFDSRLVRLKAVGPTHVFRTFVFRFQTGSIKSHTRYPPQFNRTFRFQTGSIKSPDFGIR